MTDPLFAVDGKIALVAGGTSGIGLMIARGLVRRGVKTYITGRDATIAGELAEKISAEERGACIGLGADLSEDEGPQKLADELARR